DQQAAFRLAELARRLAALFAERGIAVVLTHACEGGHPDHDAVAFAVHGAARLFSSGRLAAAPASTRSSVGSSAPDPSPSGEGRPRSGQGGGVPKSATEA